MRLAKSPRFFFVFNFRPDTVSTQFQICRAPRAIARPACRRRSCRPLGHVAYVRDLPSRPPGLPVDVAQARDRGRPRHLFPDRHHGGTSWAIFLKGQRGRERVAPLSSSGREVTFERCAVALIPRRAISGLPRCASSSAIAPAPRATKSL